MKKTILFLLMGIFLGSQISLAAAVEPSKIVVPRDDGRIVETHVAKGNGPLIAYVQDIHVNYEAQKAEVGILESLIRDYGFDLVLLEGKRYDSNTDFKRYRKESKAVRERTAEKLLGDADIVAVEYLDFISDANFTIQGIEDMTLYQAQSEDFITISAERQSMASLVQDLQNISSNLKLHIYTKALRELDEKVTAYDKDEIGLVEYIKYLQGAAGSNNIDVKSFSNIVLFSEAAGLEDAIDFIAVETERTEATDAIEKALKGETKDEFLTKGVQFRTGDISQGEFYAYLKNTAQNTKVDISKHKNLATYTTYITTYEKININLLFKEVDQLVDKLQATLLKTPEQKKLSQIDKGLSILLGFVNIKLIPDEYSYFQANKAEFDLKDWLTFLKNNSAKFNLTNPVPDDVKALDSNMPLLGRFYRVAFDRDLAFMKNIEANLKKYGKDKAILMTGGFHTENMKDLLQQKGYSYVIIAPKIDIVRDYSELYKKTRKADFEYASKVISSIPTPPGVANLAKAAGADTKSADQIDAVVAEMRADVAAHPELGEGAAQVETEAVRLAAVATAKRNADAQDGETGETGGGIGFYEVVTASYDATAVAHEGATPGAVKATLRDIRVPAGQPGSIVEVTLNAETVTPEQHQQRLAGLPQASAATGETASHRSFIEKALGQVAQAGIQTCVIDDNEYGVGGIGNKQVKGLARSLQLDAADTPIGVAHEDLEAATDAGIITLADMETELQKDAQAWAWYQNHITAGEGREGIKVHYAIRALTRFAYGDVDVQFTSRCKRFMSIFDAVTQEARVDITKSKFTYIVPAANTDSVSAELRGTLSEASAGTTQVKGYSNAANITAQVKAAIRRGETPLVMATPEDAAEIKADPALRGVPILSVADFNSQLKVGEAQANPVDNVAQGLILMRHLNTQIAQMQGQGLPETQIRAAIQNTRSFAALKAMLAELRGARDAAVGPRLFENAITDNNVLDLLALKDDTNLQARLGFMAGFPMLPTAHPMPAARQQEILASRSIFLSA